MNLTIIKQLLCASVVVASLSSCANVSFSNHTVRQGNLSVQSGVKKLSKGMSKREVANIMGTSLISPMFRTDRWDYALTIQKPRQDVSVQSVSLWFNNNKLVKIQS